MKAQTLSPASLFGHDVRYVTPLFQRPYVWNEDDQWEPLWQDVRRVAEQLLEAPAGYGAPPVPPHFLGAVVIDQPPTPSGYIAVRHIVDGQQRLTTLQLLLDAAQMVTQTHGSEVDGNALRILVLNTPAIAAHSHEVYKVWPTARDREAFVAAIDDDTTVPDSMKRSTIVRAHTFFARRVEEWAEVSGDPDKARARLNALTRALREHLKFVVIDLEPGDNAQVIFETLNHRGTPLLAADLIKNLVFQVAEAQGRDVHGLYRAYWANLDSDYWRRRIARGRQYVPRIDIFVNYWLVMRLLREVPSDRIFAEFRDRLVPETEDIELLLADLARDAQTYASLETFPADSVPGRFRYRVIQALNSAAVTPFLLWLLRWKRDELSKQQRDKALSALENWIVRRSLCRLTARGINRLIVDLLQELDRSGPATAGDVTERFLLAQTANSRLWPSNASVNEVLASTPAYTGLLRPRLRMLLEALEDKRRTDKSESGRCPRNLTVEHVMPQGWREHWARDVHDEVQAVRRDRLVQRLGNLTLVNHKLNPALSNRPWTDKEARARGLGDKGKRSELLSHSTLKLNADLVADHPTTWTEQDIRKRTAELISHILTIWPHPYGERFAPPGHGALPREQELSPAPGEPDNSQDTDGMYRPLTDWLLAQTQDSLPATFELVEQVLGSPLPPSARAHHSYWYSTERHPLGRAISAARYRASGVNLTAETVIFERTGPSAPTAENTA